MKDKNVKKNFLGVEAEVKPAHTVVLATTQVGIIKLTSFMPVISQFLQFNSVYL